MSRQDREAYLAGRQAFERGDVERALSKLESVLDRCPSYADVHYMVGLLYERKGKLERAAASLERAVEINRATPKPPSPCRPSTSDAASSNALDNSPNNCRRTP